MAKPGSGDAARIAAAGGRLVLSDEQAFERQTDVEMALGMRCQGCGRRVTTGFRFRSIDVRAQDTVIELVACSRPDCDFAEKCREGGTAAEMVEFIWLDAGGQESPAAPRVARRNERRAVAEATRANGSG